MKALFKKETLQKFPFYLILNPVFIAIIGGVLYAVQLWHYAHISFSRLDESAYLYKGYLFVTGQYAPFSPGIWTNKMPLAFLIPGYVQAWFGPGLRTGRYFAIFIALLMVFVLWLIVRRLSNKWWGAGVVWLFALSISFVRLYNLAISQVLIAFMLVWIMELCLGGDRKIWQLASSAIVASLMILTRQNMVVVLPILLLYIFFQYGYKAGLWSSLASLIVLIGGHALWWPEILQLWVPWLPEKISISLQSLYLPADFLIRDKGVHQNLFSPTFSSRILSFFRVYRFHIIIFNGVLATLILWPKQWKNKQQRNDTVFLIVLFSVLSLMHAWASLGKDYCVYCWSLYFDFFSVSGIVLIVLSIRSWKKELPTFLTGIVFITILILTTGTGYSAFEEIGETLLSLEIPRIKDGQVLSGTVTLLTLIGNKFGLSYSLSRQYISVFFGFIVGCFFLALVFLLRYFFLKRAKINFGYLTLISFLILSAISFPFITMSERNIGYNGDIILAHEDSGVYLAEYISSGSSVYWEGGTSLLPLLYIPDGVKIYPTQLNYYNNYVIGGDPATVLALGSWNDELDQQWKQEAEYIVVVNYLYTKEWKQYLDATKYEEMPRSAILLDDRPDSFLRIFRRK